LIHPSHTTGNSLRRDGLTNELRRATIRYRTFFIEGHRVQWRDGDIVFCEGRRQPFDGRKQDDRGDSLIVLFLED